MFNLDEIRPKETKYEDLIKFVNDRPGHDCHYAIDASKIQTEIGWQPERDFDQGLKETVSWFLREEIG